jgi:hypothetical protein
VTMGDDETLMTTHAGSLAGHAEQPSAPAPLEDRARRNLALVIGVTIAVMAFGLATFAWMYWIAPIQ